MKRNLMLSIVFAFVGMLHAQTIDSWHMVRELPQKHFRQTIPSGNYSGIIRLYDDVYAMVSDKSDSALYFNVRLYISKQTGELLQAEWLSGHGKVDLKGLDNEAIARVSDHSVVIANEGKCRLKEYLLDSDSTSVANSTDALAMGDSNKKLWGWSMSATEFYDNYTFESATYDSLHHKLWTINESAMRRDGKPATPKNLCNNVLRLISFDWADHSKAPVSYLYRMDMPTTMKTAKTYVMGVSELCALPDGQLLVLEREAFIPKVRMGAFCQCKLYIVDPSTFEPYAIDRDIVPGAPYVEKRLLTSWRTSLTMVNQTWANYEGMCLGPQLENGDQVVVLVSDSQNGYAGVLRDWFKTIVISKK
mgnify:CR=1 FL=1